MAKKQGLWAEMQRERARKERARQQEFREFRQAADRAQRDRVKAERAAARAAAVTERERKRLYVEERKAEAAGMTEALTARVAELDAVLTAGIRRRPLVTFTSLKRTHTYPPFEAGELGVALPPPLWEEYAPAPPRPLGKLFGGAGRSERAMADARATYSGAIARHAAAEDERRRRLAARRAAYDTAEAAAADAVREHNAWLAQFEADCRALDSEAVARFCTLALDSTAYPDGFPRQLRALYRPEPREALIDWELPAQPVIPMDKAYKYVATRDVIEPGPRAEKEIKDRYRTLIAQVAIRTMHEVFVSTPAGVIDQVTFYGNVSGTDPATGQPARYLVLTVSAARDLFTTFALAELDPVACLHRLNALMSPHPYDLEPVKPTVNFDLLLTQFKFIPGMDVIAGLDGRRDLLELTPTEFEHLVRQLFEEMGMEAWNTREIKDDGVDAVAVSKAPVFGGLCVIQAKRYRHAVGIEAVRALAGTMEDKRATKGIMVTTSWVTKDGHAFAARHGRIEIIECEQLKFLCKEHLGEDVLISLPKSPPGR